MVVELSPTVSRAGSERLSAHQAYGHIGLIGALGFACCARCAFKAYAHIGLAVSVTQFSNFEQTR